MITPSMLVTSAAKTERTDSCDDEATADTGGQKHSEQGPSDPSPIEGRK
jgi:hypothetical protein